MDSSIQPRRCPHCNALVVDRRSPACTTCRAALPAEWIMTKVQANKVMKLDADCRAFQKQELQKIDPLTNPNMPPFLRLLMSDVDP
jgi:hypothetical protein